MGSDDRIAITNLAPFPVSITGTDLLAVTLQPRQSVNVTWREPGIVVHVYPAGRSLKTATSLVQVMGYTLHKGERWAITQSPFARSRIQNANEQPIMQKLGSEAIAGELGPIDYPPKAPKTRKWYQFWKAS